MKVISAIVRPHRLDDVKAALTGMGLVGLTITEVRGAGRQKGHVERYRGSEYSFDLIPKVKVEVAVPEAQYEETLQAICDAAHTGEIGDGKIFVYTLTEAVRIRTGERGDESLV